MCVDPCSLVVVQCSDLVYKAHRSHSYESAPPGFELAEACHEALLDCIASKEKFEDAIIE